MIEQINSPMLDQVHTRELHDLANLRLVVAPVTLGFAFLAHGFWVMRTREPHAQTVREQTPALIADKYILLLDPFDVQLLHRKGRFLTLVVFTAVNSYKPHEGAYI